jgi:hypothetical protein
MTSLHGKELYKNCQLICLQHTLSCIKIEQSLSFAFFVYAIFFILYFLINVDMNYSILDEKGRKMLNLFYCYLKLLLIHFCFT